MNTDRISNLEWRGLLQDCTNRDAIEALSSSDGFYVGYDPSAPSLQLGNFVPMVASLHLARSGLRCIQLFGGATGAIGDPSGRRIERQLLDRDTIEKHVSNHKQRVTEIFARAGVEAQFVDNFEWTKNVSILDFLRDVGKHFTVNYMLAKDSVQLRIDGDGMSFTEFSYMLLQAFDFYHLRMHQQCKLQIGGSDQWGNITAGLELIRKKGLDQAYALSIPLLLDSQGRKFGKSATGSTDETIWLDPALTSPYKFHQFWLNVDDTDAIRYLKIFTFLSQDQIQALESATKTNPEARSAQKALADEVCTLVHGPEATALAKASALVLFGGSLSDVSDQQLEEIFRDVPSSELSRSGSVAMNNLDLFAQSGLAKSKGEARRLIQNGGAYINNIRVTEGEAMIKDSVDGMRNVLLLRSGKKSYHLIRLVD